MRCGQKKPTVDPKPARSPWYTLEDGVTRRHYQRCGMTGSRKEDLIGDHTASASTHMFRLKTFSEHRRIVLAVTDVLCVLHSFVPFSAVPQCFAKFRTTLRRFYCLCSFALFCTQIKRKSARELCRYQRKRPLRSQTLRRKTSRESRSPYFLL